MVVENGKPVRKEETEERKEVESPADSGARTGRPPRTERIEGRSKPCPHALRPSPRRTRGC